MPTEDVTTEPERARRLVEELCTEFPSRRACGYQERRIHENLAQRAEALGAETRTEPFEFNQSLYGLLALHFGVAAVAAFVVPWWPGATAVVLLLVGVSYWADATRRRYILRRLLPWRPSRNVLATLPSRGPRRLRVVLPAHVDAAFTGRIFDPALVRLAGGGRSGERQPYHARSMEMATDAVFAVAVLALGRMIFGFGGPFYRCIELLLALPSVLVFVANMEVVLRDEIVPGAADNLSGVVTNLLLIERFAADRPDGVELVFAFTGAEEAGTGGAWAMARDHAADWSTEDTVVVGVDTTSNGDLRWLVDGEVERVEIATSVVEAIEATVRSDPRFAGVRRFEVPVGGTDAMPFLARGYPGVTIGCVDTGYGAPRHYHHPNDRPEHVSGAEIVLSTNFVEQLVRTLASEAASSAVPSARA